LRRNSAAGVPAEIRWFGHDLRVDKVKPQDLGLELT
jgi:hypothetical protein